MTLIHDGVYVYIRNNRAQVEPRVLFPQCRLQSAAPLIHARSPQVAKAGTLTICL